MNFVFISLCDNDFGYDLLTAAETALAEEFFESAGEDARWWKLAITYLVLSYGILRRYKTEEETKSVQSYFDSRLQVIFCKKWPTYENGKPIDHDGGSVVIDLNLKKAHQV